jgi:hypothetical protein
MTTKTVEALTVFDTTVFVDHCDREDYYKNQELMYSVDCVFNLAEIKNRVRTHEWDSHVGTGETSEIVPYLGPANIPGGKDLTTWVIKRCKEITKSSNVILLKSWMNRLNTGSQGRCHNHISANNAEPTPDMVAIFYVNNTENGSNLVFIKNGVHGALHSEFEETDKVYIEPKSGDLIFHKSGIWHAVTEHNSKEPRICFVYHFKLDNK